MNDEIFFYGKLTTMTVTAKQSLVTPPSMLPEPITAIRPGSIQSQSVPTGWSYPVTVL